MLIQRSNNDNNESDKCTISLHTARFSNSCYEISHNQSLIHKSIYQDSLIKSSYAYDDRMLKLNYVLYFCNSTRQFFYMYTCKVSVNKIS